MTEKEMREIHEKECKKHGCGQLDHGEFYTETKEKEDNDNIMDIVHTVIAID